MANDKNLDQRLAEQKEAYDGLPSLSTVDHIMGNIEGKAQKNRRHVFLLPFAASIAALCVVAALVLSQIQSGQVHHTASDKGGQDSIKTDSPNTQQYHTEKTTSTPFIPEQTPSTVDEAQAVFKKMQKTGAEPSQIDGEFTKFLQSVMEKQVEREVKLSKLAAPWYKNRKDMKNPESVFTTPNKIKDADLRSYVKKLVNEGYAIRVRGGNLELHFAYDSMKRAFTPYVSDSMDAFLQIEANQIVTREGYFAGSWDHLGEELVAIDLFLKKHSEFPFAADLKNKYNLYLQWYLFGLNYKPTTEKGSNLVKKEVRDSFQALMAQYPNTETAQIVGKYYNQLKQHGFKKTNSFKISPLPDYLAKGRK